MAISNEEAILWKKKHTIDDNNITTWQQCQEWGELGIKDEEEFNQIMMLGKDDLLKQYYDRIYKVLEHYLDIPEEHKITITLWILGSYIHKEFETYPYLFLNAMRGSGKTRALKLITKLANGDILLSMTEAALFRSQKTLAIDEFESLASKDKQALRELLNAGYKRGMTVSRMKKVHTKDGDEYQEQRFDVYRPIVMANINGMEEVLGDRCITLILEKSNNPRFTKIIEDFDKNKEINDISLELSSEKCSLWSVVTKKNIDNVTKWNLFISKKYGITTHTTLSTLTTLTTLTTEEEELFNKLDEANIDGRNLELYFPFFQIAKLIDGELLDKVLEIAKLSVQSRKVDEYGESRDVTVYQLISSLEPENFYSIKELVQSYRFMLGDGNIEWLNSKWFGKALKRLVLVIDKKKMSDGIHVRVNSTKAKEKLLLFN